MQPTTNERKGMFADEYAEEWISDCRTKLIAFDNWLAFIEVERKPIKDKLASLDQEKYWVEALRKTEKEKLDHLLAIRNRTPIEEIPF